MEKSRGIRVSILGAAALLMVAMAGNAFADSNLYESIPSPLPGNVASEGPEAYSFSQIGDAVTLGVSNATLTTVRVVLSSWGCVNGNWYTAGTCVTPPGSKFSQPITMNIYAVDTSGPTPLAGALLGTITQTFNIPYRPSSDATHCDGTAWYNPFDQTCYHGLAYPVTFDFSSQHISLPSQVLVGIQYNTTHYGPTPVGESAACFMNGNNCPYDSLNVSTDGQVYQYENTPGNPPFSEVFDPNGIFFNYSYQSSTCNGASAAGVFQDDDSSDVNDGRALLCWTGYHVEMEINGKCGNGFFGQCNPGNGFGHGPFPHGHHHLWWW